MGFKKGLSYELIDAEGLSSAHGANPDLVNDILETGGIVIPVNVSERGDVIGVTYGDGSYNYFSTLWASEVRFFQTKLKLNDRVAAKDIDRIVKHNDYIVQRKVNYENIAPV